MPSGRFLCIGQAEAAKMDEVHRELEETKIAMEKLTADLHAKSEFSDNLRNAYDEQCSRLQDATRRIREQAIELNEKQDEIAEARRMYEDLRLSLHEKESALNQMTFTHDQLKVGLREKLATLDGENRDLETALRAANGRTEEQSHKISAYEEEVEKLRRLLLESQKKCSEAERKAKDAVVLKRREQVVAELEKENGKMLEQLKWKTEQFRHLEEAKEKIQDQFQVAAKEWQLEKSILLDEIYSLQKNLESKTRVIDDLTSRLQLCNQALVHEQSRRKMLESQVSESKVTCENVLSDYEEAKLATGKLTALRDNEIADLRNLLATKDTLLKESEYRKTDLERENQELHACIKGLQEAKINESGVAALLKNARQKLRSLEQVHRECPTILKAKEAEWNSELEKLQKELSVCLSQIGSKRRQHRQLQTQLEADHISLLLLKLENEEMSVIIMVLLSKFSEVQSEIGKMTGETQLSISEKDRQIAFLKEQVQKISNVFNQAKSEIEAERAATKKLLERLEFLEHIEQEYFLTQKELDHYKKLLEKSCSHVKYLKSVATQKESSLSEELKSKSDELYETNSALVEKQKELSTVKLELSQCKSAAERLEKLKVDAEVELKYHRDECQSIKRELETSVLDRMETVVTMERQKGYLLRTMEEKDRQIEEYEQYISRMKKHFANQQSKALLPAKVEAEVVLRKEEQRFLKIARVKEKRMQDTQKELDLLMQELLRVDIEATLTLERERNNLVQVTKGKEEEMTYLQKHILVLEEEFFKSLRTAVSMELADKQLEVDTLYLTLEKSGQAYVLTVQELEYKKLVGAALEEEFELLKQEVELRKIESFDMRKHVIGLQSELQLERTDRGREMMKKDAEFESMHNSLKDEVKELKQKNKELHDAVRHLSSERQELVLQMTEFSNLMTEFMRTDNELSRKWEKVPRKAELYNNYKGEILYLDRTNGKHANFPRNKTRFIPDDRKPLKECNS